MSLSISISPKLKQLCPKIALGVMQYTVEVKPNSLELNTAIAQTIDSLKNKYKLEDIAKLPQVANTRAAYKALGKAPSEYRNSAEAMLRRIVKDMGLYQINNVVDTGNLFSILSGFSVGSYDLDNIEGAISLEYGDPSTHYEGIGKTSVNTGNLPVLSDNHGAFGNPCGDSKRTLVTLGNHKILTAIYAFCLEEELISALNEYENLLKKYCSVNSIEKEIIK